MFDRLTQFELPIVKKMYALHGKSPARDKFFEWCARYLLLINLILFSAYPVLSLLTGGASFFQWLFYGGIVWGPIVISWLVTLTLQFSLRRKRPYQELNRQPLFRALADSTSFPSAHTTVAFAMLGWLIGIFFYGPHGYWHGDVTPWVYILLVSDWIIASLISFSRLYIGVHYFSDLIAGFLVGGGISLLLFIKIIHFLQ